MTFQKLTVFILERHTVVVSDLADDVGLYGFRAGRAHGERTVAFLPVKMPEVLAEPRPLLFLDP